MRGVLRRVELRTKHVPKPTCTQTVKKFGLPLQPEHKGLYNTNLQLDPFSNVVWLRVMVLAGC